MPILNVQPNEPGQSGVIPQMIRIETNDSLATIEATGYLTEAVRSGLVAISEVTTVFMCYSAVQGHAPTLTAFFQPAYSAGQWSLTQIGGGSLAGAVLLTPAGNQHITADSLFVDNGNLVSGNSSFAGSLILGGGNGNANSMSIVFGASGPGAGSLNIQNEDMGQNTDLFIPDPGVTAGTIPSLNATVFTSGNLPAFSGTSGVLEDSGIAAANVPASPAVLLAPSGDQTITSNNLTLATGNFYVTEGSVAVGNLTAYGPNDFAISNITGTPCFGQFYDGSGAGNFFQVGTIAPLGQNVNLNPVGTFAQSTTFGLQDPGVASTNVVCDQGATTMQAGSKISLDKGTGAEVANAVTINAQSGQVTTSSLTVTPGSTYVITLTNSVIVTTSLIFLAIQNDGSNTMTDFDIQYATPTAGSVVLTITNNSVATNISGTIIFNFVIF